MPTPIVIGTPDAFVQLVVTGRPYADATISYDRDYLTCDVSGRSEGFQFVLGPVGLLIEDLTRLSASLRRIYDSLTGEALLRPLEPWLDVRLQGDGRGHLKGLVHVRTLREPDTSLQFSVALDQTYLPDLLASIDGAIPS